MRRADAVSRWSPNAAAAPLTTSSANPAAHPACAKAHGSESSPAPRMELHSPITDVNADASPPLRPLVCKEAVPSLEGLPDALTRHPLLPLDSQPLAAANLYSAPTPSTGAATNRSKLELLLASHGISLYR